MSSVIIDNQPDPQDSLESVGYLPEDEAPGPEGAHFWSAVALAILWGTAMWAVIIGIIWLVL